MKYFWLGVFLGAALVLGVDAFGGDIHRCVVDGRTVYTDTPPTAGRWTCDASPLPDRISTITSPHEQHARERAEIAAARAQERAQAAHLAAPAPAATDEKDDDER